MSQDRIGVRVPQWPLNVTGLADVPDDPDGGVQFAVLTPDGERHVYGDQQWIAYGGAVAEAHPDGRVQYRDIFITYGPWADYHPGDET
jgi:hypothetical protein